MPLHAALVAVNKGLHVSVWVIWSVPVAFWVHTWNKACKRSPHSTGWLTLPSSTTPVSLHGTYQDLNATLRYDSFRAQHLASIYTVCINIQKADDHRCNVRCALIKTSWRGITVLAYIVFLFLSVSAQKRTFSFTFILMMPVFSLGCSVSTVMPISG